MLSHEKVPTLCQAIPAFEALTLKWEEYVEKNPESRDIVMEGINKLEEYRDRADVVPAYILAMGKCANSLH
jgi:hypothetical protein